MVKVSGLKGVGLVNSEFYGMAWARELLNFREKIGKHTQYLETHTQKSTSA